jgi:hypothetical protein
MAEPGQIDIEGSRLKIAAIFLTSLAIVALCGGMLWFRPSSGPRSFAAGSAAELALIVGVAFFGLAAVILAKRFFRAGPVVSVGPRGIFDRRLSYEWLPWDAIEGIGIEEMRRQRWLALTIAPAREDGLPLHAKAKFLARLNRGLGSRGYTVGASDLKGGIGALLTAVKSTAPARLPIR